MTDLIIKVSNPHEYVGEQWRFITVECGVKYETTGILEDYCTSSDTFSYALSSAHISRFGTEDEGTFEGSTVLFENEIIESAVIAPILSKKKTKLNEREIKRKYLLKEEDYNPAEECIGNWGLDEKDNEEQVDLAELSLADDKEEWIVDMLHEIGELGNVVTAERQASLLSKTKEEGYKLLAESLMAYPEVGLVAFGKNKELSRLSNIKYIILSTIELGCVVFKWNNESAKLLKPVLESSYVLKICHDCRGLSDALKNVRLSATDVEIELDYVVDIANLDCHVLKKYDRKQNFPKSIRPLEYVIEHHLPVEIEWKFFDRMTDVEHRSIFTYPNLTTVAKNFIRRKCAFMIPLKQALEYELLKDVFRSNSFFLISQREANDRELRSLLREARENDKMEFITKPTLAEVEAEDKEAERRIKQAAYVDELQERPFMRRRKKLAVKTNLGSEASDSKSSSSGEALSPRDDSDLFKDWPGFTISSSNEGFAPAGSEYRLK